VISGFSPTSWRWLPMDLHSTPKRLQGAFGWPYRRSKSSITRQNGTAKPTAVRPSECLCRLCTIQCISRVYLSCGPGFEPVLACRSSETDPFNLRFRLPHGNT
jgi:hypothetical protein